MLKYNEYDIEWAEGFDEILEGLGGTPPDDDEVFQFMCETKIDIPSNAYYELVLSAIQSEIESQYPDAEVSYYVNSRDTNLYINEEPVNDWEEAKEKLEQQEEEFARGGMTISEIKRRTSETSPHFFDRKSMKFFGQRMSDFKVSKQDDGKYLISAPTYRTDYRTGKRIKGSPTQRLFNPETNELEIVPTTYAHGGQIDYGEIRENLQSLGLPTDAGDRTLLVEEINERYNIDCGEVIRALSDDDVYVAVDGVLRDYGVYASDGYVDDYTKDYAKGGEISDDDYAEYLNEVMSYLDYEDDEWIIGGKNRVDEYWGRYGEALREYDTIAFEVGKNEYERGYAKGGKIMKTYDDFGGDYDEFTNYVMDRIDTDERRKIRKDWNDTGGKMKWQDYLLKRVNEKSYAKGGSIKDMSFGEFYDYLNQNDLGYWDNVNSEEIVRMYIDDMNNKGVNVSHIEEVLENNPSRQELYEIWLGNSMETPTPINTKEDLLEALDLDKKDYFAKGGMTFDLTPSDRKSFYGKAKVITKGGINYLQSYSTIVAEYNPTSREMKIYDYYSPTTARHINAFLNHYGYPSMSKSEIMANKNKSFAKGGKVKKVEKKENNEMLIGGIAGILLGIFLNR